MGGRLGLIWVWGWAAAGWSSWDGGGQESRTTGRPRRQGRPSGRAGQGRAGQDGAGRSPRFALRSGQMPDARRPGDQQPWWRWGGPAAEGSGEGGAGPGAARQGLASLGLLGASSWVRCLPSCAFSGTPPGGPWTGTVACVRDSEGGPSRRRRRGARITLGGRCSETMPPRRVQRARELQEGARAVTTASEKSCNLPLHP